MQRNEETKKFLVGLLVGGVMGLFLRPYLLPRYRGDEFLLQLHKIGKVLPEGCVEIRSVWKQGLGGAGTTKPRVWSFYQSLDTSQTREMSDGYYIPQHLHRVRDRDLIDRISEHYEAQLDSVGGLDFTVFDNSYNSSFAAFSAYPKPYFLTLYTNLDPWGKDPRLVHVIVTFTVTTGFDTFDSLEASEESSAALNRVAGGF